MIYKRVRDVISANNKRPCFCGTSQTHRRYHVNMVDFIHACTFSLHSCFSYITDTCTELHLIIKKTPLINIINVNTRPNASVMLQNKISRNN